MVTNVSQPSASAAAEQIFELAQLVAAAAEPEIVALHPQSHAVGQFERAFEPLQPLDRRRRVDQREARECAKLRKPGHDVPARIRSNATAAPSRPGSSWVTSRTLTFCIRAR